MVFQKCDSNTNDQNKKIFLGGLSLHTTDETLHAFCSRFGKMTDCVVIRNPDGKTRCFGFITYEDISSVEDFMSSRPHTIDNRQIMAKRAIARKDQNNTDGYLTVNKLYISGLHNGDIDEANLREYFSRFGNITDVLIMKNHEGTSRGFAFVSFDDYDAVDKAILEKSHVINGHTLHVTKAVPKQKIQERSTSTKGNNRTPSNRNNFRPIRNNFNGNGRDWGNQSQSLSYGQQGYNSSRSGYNPLMSSNTNGFPSTYNSMGQQQSMMNYNPYNNNNNSNQPTVSYGQNQQQGYGDMNNPFNLPSQQTNNWSSGGYNNSSSSSTPFNNSNSYEITSQSYGNTGFNYNNMPQQQASGRGVAPMHGRRGRGNGPYGRFTGSNKSSNHGNRPAPYSKRGVGSSNYGQRGRGRGQ